MLVVTDKQRQEVARKLRELHPEDKAWWGIYGFDWYMFADSLFDAIGCNDSRNWTDYLADLIEPPARCPHYMFPCCRTDAAGDYIDRDTPLALADEMDAYTKCDDERCGREMPPRVIRDFARRIRRALGEGTK